MTIYANLENLCYCCGVSEVGYFSFTKHNIYDSLENIIQYIKASEETGYIVCTFIDDGVCKDAYDFLCKHTKLVSQTPPKISYVHANNKVFVAVFDCKGK